MESDRKRKGFVKGKLMPAFYRSSTKPNSSNVQYGTKVKPGRTSPTTASVGYHVVHHHPDYNMIAPQKQKVSFIVPAAAADHRRDKLCQFDKFFGVVGDASVDIKATVYISSVQERFKLERTNSERKAQQEDEQS